MKVPELTPEEQAHVDQGGRVFIVEECNGLYRILSVRKDGVSILIQPTYPETKAGYSDRAWAVEIAQGIAGLAEDAPMVRP